MTKEPSDIARLTERISKDPNSKLFVQLAEEHKKIGDIDMAIHVLSEGLKSNPDYITARSVLGKFLLEKGELADAQREFEEVVRAVPGNIMARRSLGDLLALQNRAEDALEHYKIVVAANPEDGELAALIARLEAGRESEEKPQTETTAAGAEFLTASARSQDAGQIFETPSPSILQPFEEEVAEEVFAVEPLEDEDIEREASVLDFGSAVQQEEAAPEALSQENQFESPVFSGEPTAVEPGMGDERDRDQETVGATEASPLPASEESIPAAAPSKEEFAETAASPLEGVEQADDFTTDTLAELYIAQGFYEKAIDIYERMLADKPESAGLFNKLELVKEMAAQAASAETASFGEDQEQEEYGIEETDDYPPALAAEDLAIDDEPPDSVIHDYVTESAGGHFSSGQEGHRPRAGNQQAIDRLENWLRTIQKRRT